MGPPRRNASHPTTLQTQQSNGSPAPPQSPTTLRQPFVASLQPQPNLGMSPASRYQHNLKVLRRRDPSILSIFDQFSHVCLYHHNGTKWEKQGYEGSMFLYERESYPPYGFYILNRMGMDDHIQRLYPEDSIGAHGSYLIIRSYPEYTDRRLALARSSPSHEIPHKFSDVYAIPNVDKLTAEEKGESNTIGLWMFTTDSREPLIDIFTRLHSYIKKNISYPQEFRYGPDRPPPSNPPSRATIATVPNSASTSQIPKAATNNSAPTSQKERSQGQFQNHHPSQAYTNGGVSELDKLFAKIDPTPVITPAAVASPPAQMPTSTSNMTVESLFAALGGKDLTQPTNTRTSSTGSLPSTSMTGINLLQSIFASADNFATHPTTQPSTNPELITIYSPAPTTNALPQILTQDVISTLLGLPPTRTASAASTAYSSDAQSHPSSREGDNEDESDHGVGTRRHGGSDGYSESSTVLDPDAEYDQELQAAGASAGRPLIADFSSHHAPLSNGYLSSEREQGRTLGDVTPRAPMNGFITPPFARPNPASRHPGVVSLPPSLSSLGPSSSTSTITGSNRPKRSQSQPQPPAPQSGSLPHDVVPLISRPLVPFEPDSELWPYPRAHSGRSEDNDGDEIIELDFADTSALSDPDAFQRVLNNGKHHTRSASGDHSASGREKVRGKKKGKKERVAEQMRQREEIENSWDVPGASAARLEELEELRQLAIMPDAPASPSPCPSPVRASTPPRASPSTPGRSINGVVPRQVYPVAEKRQTLPESVKASVVSAMLARPSSSPILERNDFVREVLTLIHTDKTFVDALWTEYADRAG